MQALVATPGQPGSTHVGDRPEPQADAPGIRLRTLEVGVCGTDREISEGLFGIAPEGERELILGHELLAEVLDDGAGFHAGDMVTATVRRSCGLCEPCAEGASDSCETGRYTERGITQLDGFAREIVVEDPSQLVVIPASLGRLGVLTEPASVCARAIRHAFLVGERHPWRPRRVLVIGSGAIGMIATYMLRLRGLDVWTASREPSNSARAQLVSASGAEYVSTEETALPDLRDGTGGFDLVIEAAGDAQVMLDVLGLLRANGVGCLLGLDFHQRAVSVTSSIIGVDTVLQNRILFGSVNAHISDWRAAVTALEQMQLAWPGALEAMVGMRVTPDRFADAFAFAGVKATLVFD